MVADASEFIGPYLCDQVADCERRAIGTRTPGLPLPDCKGPLMTKPDAMPRFVEWSRSFAPPATAIHYLSQRLSVTDAVVVLNLVTPPLIEVEGCVLLKDRYSLTSFAQWSAHLDGDTQAIERVINQVNLWDVFEPADPAEEQAVGDIANTLAFLWPEHARRAFPDRMFRTEITDSYGPGVTLFHVL